MTSSVDPWQLAVGDELRRDNEKMIKIIEIAPWSGGGNGDISFMEGSKRRCMTFRQFKRLRLRRL